MTTWSELTYRAGRNDLPVLLVRAWGDGILRGQDLISPLQQAWTGAEWPEVLVPSDIWVALFREAGFHVDGQPSERPSGPTTLYRGAIPQRKRGMSWTDDREQAEWFAQRFALIGGRRCAVYRVEAPGEAILARYDSRGEKEWVLHPEDLLNLTITRMKEAT